MSNRIHPKRGRLAAIGLAMAFAFAAFPARCAGCPGEPRNRRSVRGPGRLHRHEHRAVGAERRSRRLPWDVAPGFRVSGRGQRSHARQRRRRRQGAVRPHHRLQRRGRPAGRARQRPVRHGSRQSDADPGAYSYTSSAQLTGPLTLNAEGDPNAQFVFEIGAELTTAPASSVVLVNGASPCNVYWQVGSSATLDTTTAFQGNLMALTSISLNNGATVIGRVLARNGQVSLINNVLSGSQCGTGSTSSSPAGDPDEPSAGAPEPVGPSARQRGQAVPRRADEGPQGHSQRHGDRAACAAWGLHRRVPRHGPRPHDQAGRLQPGRQADRQPDRLAVPMSVRAAPGAHQVSAASRSKTPPTPRP